MLHQWSTLRLTVSLFQPTAAAMILASRESSLDAGVRTQLVAQGAMTHSAQPPASSAGQANTGSGDRDPRPIGVQRLLEEEVAAPPVSRWRSFDDLLGSLPIKKLRYCPVLSKSSPHNIHDFVQHMWLSSIHDNCMYVILYMYMNYTCTCMCVHVHCVGTY